MQWSFSALAAPRLHINHFWSHLRSTISPTCKNVGFSQKLTTEELTQCDSTPSPTTLSVWSHTYFMQKRSYYSAPSCDAFCPLWLQIHLLYFQGLPFLGLAYSSYFCLNPLLSREKKKVKVLVTQSCPTLCDPIDCSLPGCSVHGILQAKILEWVAISHSRRSSQPRDQSGPLTLQADYHLSHQENLRNDIRCWEISRRGKSTGLLSHCPKKIS